MSKNIQCLSKVSAPFNALIRRPAELHHENFHNRPTHPHPQHQTPPAPRSLMKVTPTKGHALGDRHALVFLRTWHRFLFDSTPPPMTAPLRPPPSPPHPCHPSTTHPPPIEQAIAGVQPPLASISPPVDCQDMYLVSPVLE